MFKKKPIRYNNQLLCDLVKEKGLTLIKYYTNINTNCETRIIAKCIVKDCKNNMERFTDLKRSEKAYDNPDLAIIFEYFSCIQLMKEYGRPFYVYNDLDPNFKEENKLSRYDTGIDACDLLNTIVQSKLRKNNLTWNEVSTFFASQNIFEDQHKIRWENMVISRNQDSTLSRNLMEKSDRFIDRPYDTKEMLDYCEKLYENPPKLITENKSITLRDYQIECVELIQNNKKNIIISLPTGTGKAAIIFGSFNENCKYLVLVPRIILMDQLKEELIKFNPKFKNTIQCIGDGNDIFRQNKNITFCVYNSVSIVEKYCDQFEKIFIDEAHHIKNPMIYYYEDDSNIDETESSENSEDEFFSKEEIHDSEDELVNVKQYTKIIEELTKYHNVYLSATIDKHVGFLHYEKDIRYMIEKGYLCDYVINVPIFNEDPTHKNICEYLIKNYRNIIIYCATQKEGKYINELFNTIMPNCSYYIDSNTKKIDRIRIVKNYNEGIVPFLINVRVLVEGFNSEITKGICLFNIPKSDVSIIQMIGRALRLHPTKTIANIILPFASMIDENTFQGFITTIAKNDKRIQKSYMNKKLGGYINFDKTDITNIEDKTNELKYELLYAGLGIMNNNILIWKSKLDYAKSYINTYHQLPNKRDKINPKAKSSGQWLSTQKHYFKRNEKIFKIQEINEIWIQFINEYSDYFDDRETIWLNRYESLNQNIKNNEGICPMYNTDKTSNKNYEFLKRQKKIYKSQSKKDAMNNPKIYNIWTNFMKLNPQFFMNRDQKWIYKYNDLISFTKNNNKYPKLKQDTIAIWTDKMEKEYLDKNSFLNKSEERKESWECFVTTYGYLKNRVYIEWLENLDKSKKFIDDHNKLPSSGTGDFKPLGFYVYCQHRRYKNKKANIIVEPKSHVTKCHMEDHYIPLWEAFIKDEKYKKYF